MGRRTGLQRKQGSELSAFDPAVQEKVNKIANLFLEEALERLEEKKEKGAFRTLTLPALLKEIRGMLRAIARPATSMQQINLPGAPQNAGEVGNVPARVIDADVEMDPAKVARLREAQKRHLEKGHEPT